MFDKKNKPHGHAAHKQVVRGSSTAFSPDNTRNWSGIEYAVGRHVMTRLTQYRNNAGIIGPMLYESPG